ncbi:CBS domain-containing protein [Polaromonas aquatica]|uniref:CBS domain-containing protein n=1 Tax=Polaromonas aquatica TaxID=332657 RepID=UPI003D653488
MNKIKDVMTRQVDVISPDASIAEAAQRMRTGDFGLLPVGENDRMIGAVSDRDIVVRAVAEGKAADTRVREVMSEGILWAYDDDSVEDAVKIMSKHQVRRLPIINHDKRLVGIVALGDLAVNKELQPAAKALAGISA